MACRHSYWLGVVVAKDRVEVERDLNLYDECGLVSWDEIDVIQAAAKGLLAERARRYLWEETWMGLSV